MLKNTLLSTSKSIGEVMKEAVLPKSMSLFGINVSPGVISGFCLTFIILLLALIFRFLIFPKFKEIPGKFQVFVEWVVSFFDNTAKSNSPHTNKFLSCYIFCAGIYIFLGTVFELLGFQWFNVENEWVTLPAVFSDLNACIAISLFSYGVILIGGTIKNGFSGAFSALKDFSLPISMSFRIFGSLLSGLLVTELVYFARALSVVFPIVIAVLFTLLHAIIQTYILTLLTSMFYGEAVEKKEKKEKKRKVVKVKELQ